MKPGHSFLHRTTQELVERALVNGESLSSVARRAGCSRDQVRTIRTRLMRAGTDLPLAEDIRARVDALERAIVALREKVR